MELSIRLLKSTAIAVPKEETRHYLKGVAIQADAKGLYLIATDGHRLLAFCQSRECYGGEPVNLIIPADIVAGVKLNKHIEIAELTRESATHWRLDYCGTSMIFAPIDGTFPDWRRVIPKEASMAVAHFNPTYVGDFAKVTKALGQGDVKIAPNGEGPAIVTFGDDIDGFGLLMPMRIGREIPVQAPAWATV